MRPLVLGVLVAMMTGCGDQAVRVVPDDEEPIEPPGAVNYLVFERPKEDGTDQPAVVGRALRLPFRVRVLDTVAGLPAPGVRVSWSTAHPGASITPDERATDEYGFSWATFMPSLRKGPHTARAHLNGQVMTFSINVDADVPVAIVPQEAHDTLPPNTHGGFAVQVIDQFGNPTRGTINWTLGGNVPIVGSEVHEDGSGFSFVLFLIGDSRGEITATAALAGSPEIAPVAFKLVVN